MGEGGAKVVASLAVGSPRGAGVGGVMGNDQLAGGVKGVSGEVNGLAVEAVIGRAGGVGEPRAKVVEGKFSVV